MNTETFPPGSQQLSEESLPRFPIPVLVRDVMSSTPVTTGPGNSIHEIDVVMLRTGVHCLPVVDAQQHLVGIVTGTDIVRHEYPERTATRHIFDVLKRRGGGHARSQRSRFRRSGLTVGAIMASDVVVCSPSEPVAIACKRMVRHHVHCLPVVEDGSLVGSLSEGDVLTLFDRPDPEIRKNLEVLWSDPLWMPAGHAVVATVVDGVVTLDGTVCQQSDSAKVVGSVGQVPGVVGVVNHLTWRHPDPRPPRPPDRETVPLAESLAPPVEP